MESLEFLLIRFFKKCGESLYRDCWSTIFVVWLFTIRMERPITSLSELLLDHKKLGFVLFVCDACVTIGCITLLNEFVSVFYFHNGYTVYILNKITTEMIPKE
jgi:hypothetical protein